MSNDTSLGAFLNPEEVAEIQAHLMQMLSEEILYYTHGKSNSVSVEQAQSLFESMLYCITAYINTLADPQNALKTQNLEELYRNGLELVKQYVNDAHLLLAEAKLTRIPTDLIAYNQVIDSDIDQLLEVYDPRFGAQNTTPLSTTAIIEYPLLKDDLSVTGILYIINYLTELIKENKFCEQFSQNHIRSLLFAHGAKHQLDYRELLINIPELILAQNKENK